MNTLVNFLVLRPTFTFMGLRIVWYMYLANTVLQFYLTVKNIVGALAQRGITLDLWSPNFLPLMFGALVQLLMVRVLIEVAAIVILGARQSPSSE